MPEAFERCRRQGGKIRTKKLDGKYIHICVRPKGRKGSRGGRTVSGEVKTKKKK